MCGSPTHRFYLGNSDQEYICFNCYRIYIQKEKLHPKIAEKKSLQVEQFQKQNHFLGKFLSFFFIGFQDLWGERLLKGLFFLFVFFIFVLRFVYWNGVITSSIPRVLLLPLESDFLGRAFCPFLFPDGSAGSTAQTEIRTEREGDRGALMGNPGPRRRSGRKDNS